MSFLSGAYAAAAYPVTMAGQAIQSGVSYLSDGVSDMAAKAYDKLWMAHERFSDACPRTAAVVDLVSLHLSPPPDYPEIVEAHQQLVADRWQQLKAGTRSFSIANEIFSVE